MLDELSEHQMSYETPSRLVLEDGEIVEKIFTPYEGLVDEFLERGNILVITNRRAACFLEGRTLSKKITVSADSITGVSVETRKKNLSAMSNGVVLVVAGLLAYFALGLWVTGVLLATIVGIGLIFFGIFIIAKSVFAVRDGTITVHGISCDIVFPYSNKKATQDARDMSETVFAISNRMKGNVFDT